MAKKRTIGGVAGIFLDEHKVVSAARKVRESGFVKFDASVKANISAIGWCGVTFGRPGTNGAEV